MSGPVVVFTVAGRRLPYLKETVASWADVRGVDQATLVFCLEPTIDNWVIRECLLARQFAARVLVSENRRTEGVSLNPWHAMELGFRLADFVVLAEEDTPVSTDVLEYFAWARKSYEGWSNLRAICAHQIGEPLGGEDEVLKSRHFSPVVWGTWAGHWRSFFRDDWGGPNGWDAQVNAKLRETGSQVLIPARSRSQHIGEHGGAHCTPDYFPHTVSRSWQAEYGPQSYRELPRVQQEEGK
jgi:hypothetical protein